MNATISVKPHIKQFLVTQCGYPIDLKQMPELWDFFKKCLVKPTFHQDSKSIGDYSEEIMITISDDLFYRHGWYLSKTDTVKFNKKVDNFIKLLSRQYISIHVAFGTKQTTAARNFLDVFDFGSTLDPDSMAKDYYRNGPKISKNSIYDKFIQEIESNLLVNLSAVGMVSQHFINIKKSTNGKRIGSLSRS